MRFTLRRMMTEPVPEASGYDNSVDAAVGVRTVCVFGLVTTRLGKPPRYVPSFGRGLGRYDLCGLYKFQLSWDSRARATTNRVKILVVAKRRCVRSNTPVVGASSELLGQVGGKANARGWRRCDFAP